MKQQQQQVAGSRMNASIHQSREEMNEWKKKIMCENDRSICSASADG
jgi:hypothetical protein